MRSRRGRSPSVLFAVLARNRRPLAWRDLGEDFTGCRLGALFETALARLRAFRTAARRPRLFPQEHRFSATTAPVGPTKLPIAAPVTAPAVCFGIGGAENL
jgi:hypothetical protein